jgi:hypothetical protein
MKELTSLSTLCCSLTASSSCCFLRAALLRSEREEVMLLSSLNVSSGFLPPSHRLAHLIAVQPESSLLSVILEVERVISQDQLSSS